jgi:hypothetical protein
VDGYRLWHEHFFGRRFFPNELVVVSYHPCTPDPATTSRRMTRPRRPLLPISSPSTTICMSCHRHPHRRRLPHHRQPSMVSPLLPNCRQLAPLGPIFLPDNALSGEPPPTGQISPEKPSAGKRKTSPEFLGSWAKRPNGPASSAGPSWLFL